MARTTSYITVESLLDWGVNTIFGLPGDGKNGFVEAYDLAVRNGRAQESHTINTYDGAAKCVSLSLASEICSP